MPDQGPAPTWRYGGSLPQRLSRNYARYRERGGRIDLYGDADAYAENGRLQDCERLMFLLLAFDQIHKEGLPGDVAELGVYKGQTATVLARNARRLGRTCWLLDTFAGFDAKDFTGADAGRGPQFADTSLAAVRARVGEENTRYIQGFFPDTAAQLRPDGRYCLVHIDCDLYAPILSALEYFYPRMVPGGFLIVHDYGSMEWDGAEKAVDVFFADKPECIVPLPDSAGSVVIRRSRPLTPDGSWLRQKQALTLDEWYTPTHNALAAILGEGWSRPEAWGIWGVDTAHTLTFASPDAASGDLVLELDVHAAIAPARPSVRASVSVDGVAASEWLFSQEQNRGVRALALPRAPGRRDPISVTLRPETTLVPQTVNPASGDTRPLGIALHKLRLRRA